MLKHKPYEHTVPPHITATLATIETFHQVLLLVNLIICATCIYCNNISTISSCIQQGFYRINCAFVHENIGELSHEILYNQVNNLVYNLCIFNILEQLIANSNYFVFLTQLGTEHPIVYIYCTCKYCKYYFCFEIPKKRCCKTLKIMSCMIAAIFTS